MEHTSATMTSTNAVDVLRSIDSELVSGFNFERYNIPLSQIDLEHFRNALKLVRLLLGPQRNVFEYPAVK